MADLIQAVRFHDGERYVAALAREARVKLHLVYLEDSGVVHRAVDREEARSTKPLELRGRPYPVDRMVRKFRAIGRARGITEAAKAELARASVKAEVIA